MHTQGELNGFRRDYQGESGSQRRGYDDDRWGQGTGGRGFGGQMGFREMDRDQGYFRGGSEQARMMEHSERAGRGYDEDGHGYRGRMERGDVQHEAGLVKVIEVLAESERGWEDAAQRAVYEASRSIRNIKSVYIKDMQAIVNNGRIVAYRVNAKISFAIEQGGHGR